MSKDERTEAYADAMFGIAKAEGSLFTVEDQLFKVARTIEANENLRSTLTDQAVPLERRQGIVEDLLTGRSHPTTMALVSFLVASGRGKDLPEIIDRLVSRAAAERSKDLAEVRSAYPLSEDQITRLEAALSKRTGKNVEVKVIIDPSVLGGLVTEVGDVVIDGTVRHRLEKLREKS